MRIKVIIPTTLVIALFLGGFSIAQIMPLQMPDSVKAINSVDNLEPFLSSYDNYIDLRWGVERLGQIGTANDIPRLLEIFGNIPFNCYYAADRGKDIKDIVLLAIGNIGGPEALSALFSIFDKLDARNMKCADSLDLITYSCLAFGETGSPQAISRLNSIYQDSTLHWGYREDALIGLISIELAKPDYATSTDTANFILDKLSKHYSRSILEIDNYIITKAIFMVLYQASNPSLKNAISQKAADYHSDEKLKEYLDWMELRMDAAIKEREK